MSDCHTAGNCIYRYAFITKQPQSQIYNIGYWLHTQAAVHRSPQLSIYPAWNEKNEKHFSISVIIININGDGRYGLRKVASFTGRRTVDS